MLGALRALLRREETVPHHNGMRSEEIVELLDKREHSLSVSESRLHQQEAELHVLRARLKSLDAERRLLQRGDSI
jgi:hypothetical protein